MFCTLRFNRYGSSASPLVFWMGLALMVGLFYLAVSSWVFGFSGFPLDDAWIHQTYARNLANSGQLAFIPGVPSAGSTAPLWTILLSTGYLLGVPFQIWTYGLGIILLGLTGWTVARLSERLFPETPSVSVWAGLFCIFEWHLIWAAVSGMETILFIWLSLFLYERYLAGTSVQSWWWDIGLGLIGGLLTLTRPEGLGLVGIIGIDIAFRWWRQKEHPLLQRWLLITIGVGLLLVPYMAFHLYLTGLPFPNTFYAKQAEYAVILQTFPLWWRLFGNIGPPVETVQGVFRVVFIGAQILLLPGLAFGGWLTVRERRFNLLPIWFWWVSYLLLYGIRLPVTYQHGRYQIPAIVWIVLLGVWGTTRLVRVGQKNARRQITWRATRRALVLSIIILVVAFTGIGAWAYGRDVRFIESEMVTTAKWLNKNVASDVLIAAHDIGAIGYFTQRPLIDLAGLVTPEVIPIIRDEAALFDFIRANNTNYLVTFPSWYRELTQNPGLNLIYSTEAPWTLEAGGDNMAVYQIITPEEP